MDRNTRLIRNFIGLIVLAAVAGTAYAGVRSHALHAYQALAVVALAAMTSRMKVKLPGINGTMSVNMPFLLIAVVSLSSVEAIAVACVSTLVQCWPKRKGKFKPQQMLFNVSMMAFAASVASLMWNASWVGRSAWAAEPLMLAVATATFFLGQTAPVAGIIKLTEGLALRKVWLNMAQLTFPYFVVSAGMTSMVNLMSHHMGWQLALTVFPVMYGIHLSYQKYFERAVETPRPIALVRAAGAGA